MPRWSTRKFNGEVYHFAVWGDTKKEAQKYAETARQQGHKARIVTEKIGGRGNSKTVYSVYTRDKKYNKGGK